MTSFHYDLKAENLESSAISALYYNEDDETLAVVTKDAQVYRYEDVSRAVYFAFLNAPSLGRYFATVLKKEFGPSTHLGRAGGYRPAGFFDRKPADMSSTAVGTPQNLTYAADAVVDGERVNSPVEVSAHLPDNFIDLYYGGESVAVTTTNTSTITLNSPVGRKHEVVFTVDGLSDERTTVVQDSPSVAHAVEVVTGALNMLGIEHKVVKVVTYFE